MALIASEAYRVITDDTEKLMRSILHAAPQGEITNYLSVLITGELVGIHRAWKIAGGVLMGWGDEVFVSDDARFQRLTKGEV
jgi:hypothetical protein